MVGVGLPTALPKGKGVKMGILLLVMVFLIGLVAGDEFDDTGGLNLTGDPNLTSDPGVDFLDFNWDPNDPPIWTIRPEDRADFLAGKHKPQDFSDPQDEYNNTSPCENNQRAAELYKVYTSKECPARLHYVYDLVHTGGTCQWWDHLTPDLQCASFCQVRTHFAWAREVPYPHSDCHWPVKCGISEGDSTSVGWSISGTTKFSYEKAWKFGISGGFRQSWGTSYGRKFDIDLKEGECGYFTFVPVKKVSCGTMSEAIPGYKTQEVNDGDIIAWCDGTGGPRKDGRPWAKNTPNNCASQLWKIHDATGNEIPDGTTIFVYTDCKSRKPLPMEKQDEVYRAPGVALGDQTVEDLLGTWIWNSCYFYRWNKEKPILSIYLRGAGFSDDQIGVNGTKLHDGINDCAKGKLTNYKFTWYDNGYPTDDAKKRGAAWLIQGDVPDDIRKGCVGELIMEAGGTTQDKCFDG